jgi:tetratricopeptide (TPR) repeat protein
LYSAIKNTPRETAAQDPNMARQLTQVLSEYGLVVVGYGGGDESVMDVLSTISEKNDLYWCVRQGDEINPAIEKLLKEKGGFIVDIEGFDEMMNEIRHIVGFDVGKMLGSIQHRQDGMIEKLKNFDPRYSLDILAETVQALKAQARQEEEQIKKIEALSFFTQALRAQEIEDNKRAEQLYRKAIELDPNDAASQNNLGRLLMVEQRGSEEAEIAFRKAIELDPKLALPHNNLGSLLLLKGPEDYAEAEAELLKAISLDGNLKFAYVNLVYLYRLTGREAQILPLAEKAFQLDARDAAAILAIASIHRKLGNDAESARYAAQARELVRPDDWYTLASLESISGNAEAAIENLKHVTEANVIMRSWVKRDPDFEWLHNDPRFQAVVDSADPNQATRQTAS